MSKIRCVHWDEFDSEIHVHTDGKDYLLADCVAIVIDRLKEGEPCPYCCREVSDAKRSTSTASR